MCDSVPLKYTWVCSGSQLPEITKIDRMKCLIFALATLAVSQAALLLTPEVQMQAQEMCANLHHPDFLKEISPASKIEVLPHLANVCEIWANRFSSPGLPERRELLDGLSGLLGGANSKLGTLLKAASALNKAKGVFDEIKQIAPTLHDHLKGSISDVHDELQSLIDEIYNQAPEAATTAKPVM